MYERAHHRRIADILASLDAERLAATHCYFGGCTTIALITHEVRVSTDIDFLVSDRRSYRALREQISANGLSSLFRRPVPIVRGPVIDQYGIRALLGDTEPIKFEILREGRIDFDRPQPDDQICGVTRLTTQDLVASKLLANDDRWADRALFSRDIIDLAFLAPSQAVWTTGVRKAENAYGKTVQDKLIRAIDTAQAEGGWLDKCIEALSIRNLDATELAVRLNHVRQLAVLT